MLKLSSIARTTISSPTKSTIKTATFCKALSRTIMLRNSDASRTTSQSQFQNKRQSRHWPFAALGPALAGDGRRQSQKTTALRGVVFDVDGTLCEPQTYMFHEMRTALGIPKTVDILDHIHALPAGAEQEAAHEKIRAIERRAMKAQKQQPGLSELMAYLDKRGVRKGICTRNFDEPVTHLLTNFLPDSRFAPIITRSFRPPKPDPAGILRIAREWGGVSDGDASDMIMIGDSIDDMLAGSRAGAVTVLLLARDGSNEHVGGHEATDFCVTRLDEIIPVLETGSL